jgi:hypothetical protein
MIDHVYKAGMERSCPCGNGCQTPLRPDHGRRLSGMRACRGCGRQFWPAPHRENKSKHVHGETHCRYCRNALIAKRARARWTNA